MAEITQWILDGIRSHGAIAVFIGVIIESVIVPIPSPLIIMAAGTLLLPAEGGFGAALPPLLWLIVLPGAAASTLGGYFAYGIGYWGGKPLIDRGARFLGFGWGQVEKLEARLKAGRVALAIVLLRALPIVPLSLVSAALGVMRWPLGPFSLWTFAGSVPRCLFLGWLGWLLRDAYAGLAHGLDRVETIVSGLIAVGMIALVLWLRARVRRGIL